ncbi:MAG TPA: FadR/GntR family transcriptional regulator [Ktedonobacterales bacterium]|jgi:GntR family transcriptional repressor for pyruvate dehydrogenase complex
MYHPIRSSKVFEQISAQIEQLIISGHLHNGDRLPTERDLADQFHASRTAVREAMKTLAQKGLVEMRPGRGTMVIDGTSQAMQHSLGLLLRLGPAGSEENLVEVREILEPEIAARAAERASQEHLTALQKAVASMDASLEDATPYIAADNAFHRTLAQATHNALLLTFVDSIVGLLSEQRTHVFSVPGGPARGQVHHKQILEAVRRHDPEAARAAMQAHLHQVRADVETALARREHSPH